jgi:hypothetical protein
MLHLAGQIIHANHMNGATMERVRTNVQLLIWRKHKTIENTVKVKAKHIVKMEMETKNAKMFVNQKIHRVNLIITVVET